MRQNIEVGRFVGGDIHEFREAGRGASELEP